MRGNDGKIAVLFVDDDSDFLDLASRLLDIESDEIELLTESDPSVVLDRLANPAVDIDCIVSDYKMDQMDGIELLQTIRTDHPTLPFILFTAKGSEEIASETIRAGATDYVINTGSPEQYAVLANRIETIVGQQRSERLAAQHRRIDTIYRSITQQIIEQPTKDRIEAVVCDALAAFEGYDFVWIGGPNPNSNNAIEFRVWEGLEIPITGLPPESNLSESLPELVAINNDTTRVVDDIRDTALAEEHPITNEIALHSLITIPITSAKISYGALTIYSTVPDMFSGPEGEMLSDFGDMIGFAFVAAEQRQGMFSYSIQEIELMVDDPSADLIELAETLGTTVRLEGAVPRPDGKAVLFLRIGPDAPESDDIAERIKRVFDSIKARTVETGDRTTQWSVVHSSWFGESFTHHGVQLTEVIADESSVRIVLECPPSVSARDIIELAKFQFTDVAVTAQRQRSRDEAPSPNSSLTLADLTDRQRDVLETAFRNGFFAWPREATAEEVAATLDISQPAFSRHIRRGEQKVFSRLFEGESDTS